MVRFSPALAKRVKINDATKRLVFPAMDSFYQVVSADVPSKHGINAHGVIIDELLAQPNRELYDVMTKGAGDARRQPLTVILTTAGTDKRSICYEVYSKAKQVIAGTRQDEKFYPVIFEADKDDDWESEDTWVKANPSLGVTFGIEKLREAYEAAKGNPVEEKLFKQLRLNMFEGDVAKWLPIERWNDCEERYTEDDLKGRRCYGGLDLSAKTDLTAFVLVFPPESDDEKFKVLSYFWIPEESVERHIKTDRTPYDRWTQDGDILTTDGIVVNYREVEDLIISLSRKFDLTEIAMDDWNGQATAQRLTEAGLTMIQFRQGFKSMNEPTKELMNHILERRIVHNGNEVLTWNLENMVVKTDPAGNVKPDKEKSSQRIDGAVALIMALDRALKHTEPKGSVYDKRGLLVLNG
jgi:phage terminase large subunit-like protein